MLLSGLEQHLLKHLDAVLPDGAPPVMGVAVSGGGDSMALLDLLRRWGQSDLKIVSVNHGLRPEAEDELALVADYAQQHGLRHDILAWQWDKAGNLQQAAREGRRSLIAAWAQAQGVRYVALGHTKDDQAETFLMRLARGSGLDGLSAMAPVNSSDPVSWLRPLLDVPRETLRDHLRAQEIDWAEDPSNEDPRFDRVKARQMMATLAPLGLTTDRLAQTAAHLRGERDVSAWALNTAAQKYARLDAGDVVLSPEAANTLPEALFSRLMAEALLEVSGATFKPRFRALQTAVLANRPTSLHGCLILPSARDVRVTRELAAIQDLRSGVSEIWDGKWQLAPPEGLNANDMVVSALGESGIREINAWRDVGPDNRSCHLPPCGKVTG